MKPVISPSPVAGDPYAAADYVLLEARATGVRHASASELSAQGAGEDAVHEVLAAGFANAVPTTIDANHDWRDRVVTVEAFDLVAAANRPGGATDYTDWSTLGAGSPALRMGYLGTGAYSNVAVNPAVAVGAGAPPVAATGVGGTSYMLSLGANIFLYCDPTTGALALYNNTGAALHLWLRVHATADLGRH